MADNKNLMKWRFCSVCRRNHEQGRKHIFTASHKTKLSVLMAKFVKKVSLIFFISSNYSGDVKTVACAVFRSLQKQGILKGHTSVAKSHMNASI